jgi:hypothetical protein
MTTRQIPNSGTATRSARALLAGVIAAGGIGATLFVGTAVAYAYPSDPGSGKSNCENAGGTHSQQSTSVETCCFKETINDAGDHCFVYVAGELAGTHISRFHPVPPGIVGPLPTAAASSPAEPASPGALS